MLSYLSPLSEDNICSLLKLALLLKKYSQAITLPGCCVMGAGLAAVHVCNGLLYL